VEYFSHVDGLITSDARCKCELKYNTAMEKAAFNKKKILFMKELDLKLRKKLMKCYGWFCMVLKPRQFRRYIRNALNVLKSGATEESKRSVVLIMQKIKDVLHTVKEERNILQ
jgi:hypothetical protein